MAFWTIKSDQTDFQSRLEQKIDFDKPAERTRFLSDEQVYAMPPPMRPTTSFSEQEARWREIRARIPLALIAIFAALHILYRSLNQEKGMRVRLEKQVPWLAAALRSIGVLRAYPDADGFDRSAAFVRVFARYADPNGRISRTAALQMAQELCEQAGADRAGIQEDAGSSGAAAAAEADSLDQAEFVSVLVQETAAVPDLRLYVTVGEHLGVWALDAATVEMVEELYEFLVEQNNGTRLFTVPYLAAISEELGLEFAEEDAREFLTESRAVQLGQLKLAPSDWFVREPPSSLVARRKRHGEMSAEEMERIAEEVRRVRAEDAGVDPSAGTDWSGVVARSREMYRRALASQGAERQAEAAEGSQTDAEAEAEADAPSVWDRALLSDARTAEAEVRELRRRSRLLVRSHVKVPVTCSEFVDFVGRVSAGHRSAEQLRTALDVFFMMNSLKDSAGVAQTTVETADKLRHRRAVEARADGSTAL